MPPEFTLSGKSEKNNICCKNAKTAVIRSSIKVDGADWDSLNQGNLAKGDGSA